MGSGLRIINYTINLTKLPSWAVLPGEIFESLEQVTEKKDPKENNERDYSENRKIREVVQYKPSKSTITLQETDRRTEKEAVEFVS